MYWNIEFFDKTVEANIRKWPEDIMPEFLWQLNLLEKIGPDNRNIPYITPLDHGLFKISISRNKSVGCALFCISEKDKTIIILDGFITTVQQTMPDETVLARARMSEISLKDL
jgi:phage-related protein